MRLTIIILITIHALIHLLGFFKAFRIFEIKQLTLPISKPMGILWLLTFFLLISTTILHSVKISFWWILGLIGIILSQIFIINSWSDAKFGTIPNIIIGIVIIFAFSGCAFNKKISNEQSAIISQAESIHNEIITEKKISTLPLPVKKWLISTGIVGKEKTHTVWLRQEALMKTKPEQTDWYNAKAEQYFTVNPPAFIWTVNLDMSSIIKIKGRDKFVDGKGEMLIKIYSLVNVVNEKGPKIDEASLQRYLGEIVWFPSAALSPFIKWEAIDSLTAKATMEYKGTTGTGTFHFNEQGDFVKFSALRYKENEEDAKRHEWIISVKDYSIMNGVKIPSKLESTWVLKNKNWTWLKLEITDIIYNPQRRIKASL